MTREEYEEKRRRLEADAEDAKKTYIRAKAVYDTICEDLRDLHLDWQEQQETNATSNNPHTPADATDPDTLPMAPGCEHWRQHYREDLCPMPACRRCRYLEAL